MPEPLLTRRAAADLLGLGLAAVDRRIRDGELRAVRLGRGPKAPVRICPDDLREYIDGDEAPRHERTRAADLERERQEAEFALGGVS